LDRSKTTILRRLHDTIGRYAARGLTVCDIHGDNEFECARASILPIALNIVPADSHVGEVERSIRTIKERLRSCAHGLPFKRLPRLMVVHMVADTVRCLNQFPWKNGISDTMSPATVLTGAGTPDYTRMRLEFGTYVQVFEDNTPSNTLRSRSLGAIALSPTGNTQGDYYFMSLATGEKLSRHSWTVLPLTDAAIARVEAIALHQQQPLIQSSGLVVEWRPDQHIDDSEYDVDYVPPQHDPPEAFTAADYDAVDNTEVADLLADGPHPYYDPLTDAAAPGAHQDDADEEILDNHEDVFGYNENDDEHEDVQGHNESDDELGSGDDDEDRDDDFGDAGDTDGQQAGAQGAPNEAVTHHDNTDQEASDEVADQGAPNEAAYYGAPNEAAPQAPVGAATQMAPYNLRPRNSTSDAFKQAIDTPHDGKSYFAPRQFTQKGYTLTQHGFGRGFTPKTPHDFNRYIFGYVMNQMTAKAGIKKHERAAEEALMNEFAQLEELGVYESVAPATLTSEQRKGALRAINLIKEKRDGKLKGRTVAQRKTTTIAV
jgi:hypothetical protein